MADVDRDVWDLLPSYALDAVDDLERRAVERLLKSDPEARRALDEYRDVVAAFAVEQQPPEHLRDVVMSRVAQTPQGSHPAFGPAGAHSAASSAAPSSRPRGRRRWGLVAVAAAAVVAVAVPTTIAVQEHRAGVEMQVQADHVARMIADPDARIVTSPVSGGGDATVLISGDDVLLTAADMPDPGEGHDWQLWTIADGAPVSAGMMPHEDDGVSTAIIPGGAGQVVAVTLEPSGGSEAPTTDPVVALET